MEVKTHTWKAITENGLFYNARVELWDMDKDNKPYLRASNTNGMYDEAKLSEWLADMKTKYAKMAKVSEKELEVPKMAE